MKINLHIERVVLDGLPVSAAERPLLQRAMEAELTQLLRNSELSDELWAGASLTHVRAGAIRVSKESRPKKLGVDIAQAVQQGLGYSGRGQSATVRRRSAAESRSPLLEGNPR